MLFLVFLNNLLCHCLVHEMQHQAIEERTCVASSSHLAIQNASRDPSMATITITAASMELHCGARHCGHHPSRLRLTGEMAKWQPAS